MYAVIESGGKQHKVVEGEVLKLEKIDAEAGQTVSFDKVMMIGSDEKVTVGQPYVDAGSVSAEVVTHGRHDKINIIKYYKFFFIWNNRWSLTESFYFTSIIGNSLFF